MVLDPRIPKTSEAGARPCGHLVNGAAKEVIYGIDGPLPALRAKSWSGAPGERTLLLDARNGGGARCILPLEIWMAHGGTGAVWARLVLEGVSEEDLVAWAVRAAPPDLARAVTWRCIRSVTEAAKTPKAGICSLPHEEGSWRRLQEWIRSWRTNPARPARRV